MKPDRSRRYTAVHVPPRALEMLISRLSGLCTLLRISSVHVQLQLRYEVEEGRRTNSVQLVTTRTVTSK